MQHHAWEPFLLDWERDILASRAYREALPYLAPDIARRQTLRNPGANEKQLQALEQRLGATLPPSYRAFLTYTNGWRQAGLTVEQLWSTEEVEWFAVRNQEWIDGWKGLGVPVSTDEEYLDYHTTGPQAFREEYLDSLLEVSNTDLISVVYVLNPKIVTTDGEWEAWRLEEDFARYPSFWDLMNYERETFRYVEQHSH